MTSGRHFRVGVQAAVRTLHSAANLDSGGEDIRHCFSQFPLTQEITIRTPQNPGLPNRHHLFRGGLLGCQGPFLPIGLHLHSSGHKTVLLQSEHPQD